MTFKFSACLTFVLPVPLPYNLFCSLLSHFSSAFFGRFHWFFPALSLFPSPAFPEEAFSILLHQCGPEKPRIQIRELTHLFACLPAPLTCSLAPPYLLRSRTPLRLLVCSLCSLDRSWETKKVNDSMAIFPYFFLFWTIVHSQKRHFHFYDLFEGNTVTRRATTSNALWSRLKKNAEK